MRSVFVCISCSVCVNDVKLDSELLNTMTEMRFLSCCGSLAFETGHYGCSVGGSHRRVFTELT